MDVPTANPGAGGAEIDVCVCVRVWRYLFGCIYVEVFSTPKNQSLHLVGKHEEYMAIHLPPCICIY